MALLNLLVLIIMIVFVNTYENRYELKQVLIMSRHNVRTPLSKDLNRMTPKPWPQWKEKSGHLTSRGKLLEGYFGKYFSFWLYKEGLLPENCPDRKDIFVYANTKQRTIASAVAFVENAFPNCNVTVHYNSTDVMDPLFNPVIHNTTEIFKEIALKQMKIRLSELLLNDSYSYIENILDYKDSDLCKNLLDCDLRTDKNIINFSVGSKPNVVGPLKIANSVIDAFIMEFYEGFKNVAWGEISETDQWNRIINISRGYHNVIFNTTLVARDIAEPLINYMAKLFTNKLGPKVTLLMGHDANMYTLLNGMGFLPYNLRGQHEITPIGGKIVFQRWFDIKGNRDLLKIYYIYMTSAQMRDAQELSLTNPPEFTLLELKDCPVDKDGFCPWEKFEELLKKL